MALIGNYSVYDKLPLKYCTGPGSATAGGFGARGNYTESGRVRSRMMQDKTTTALTYYALPNGGYPSLTWFIPQKVGQIGSSNQIYGNGVSSGNLAGGLNAEAPLTGAGNITNANLTLIAQFIAALTGAGNITNANLLATVEVSAGLIGESSLAAARTAIAYLASDATGASTLTAVNYAIGSLSADILSYGALTPQGISDAIWAQVIESGLTSAEILRIMASALAGKVSGAGTGVETFVGLDETTNRIISTVDVDGNRTSVVVDGA